MLAETDPMRRVRAAVRGTVRWQGLVNAGRAWWPGVMALAACAALGLVVAQLGPVWQSLFALVACCLIAVVAWRGLAGFAPASEADARRAMERRAGVAELAPLTALDDRPADGDRTGLWQVQAERTAAVARTLTRPAPPDLGWRDAAKAAALAAALGVAALDPPHSFGALVPDLSPLAGDGPLALEVWADPPELTGRPSVRLDPAGGPVQLPVGSTIRVTLDGARGAPVLELPGPDVRLTRAASGAWQGRAVLAGSGRMAVRRLGARAVWQVEAVPDAAPVIEAIEPPVLDARGRLVITLTARDDYGIDGALLVARPRDPPEGLRGAAPIGWELTLPQEAEPGTALQLVVDVARHPLAGLPVELWVEVRDGAEQSTASPRFDFQMPEPDLSTDLAAALQEVRLAVLRETRGWGWIRPDRVSLMDPASGLPITMRLDAPFEAAPPGIRRAVALIEGLEALPDLASFDPLGFLTLQIVRQRLSAARTIDEAHAVDDALWPLVVRAAAGGRTQGQQAVDAARNALEQALRNGASDSEVEQLTQQLREAVRQRLEELAQQGSGSGDGQSQGQGSAGTGGPGMSGEGVTEDDIAGMLDRLEQDGTGGARADALRQLEDLDRLMQGLQPGGQPGQSASAGGGSGEGQGSALDGLMREQEQLSDETISRDDGSGTPAPDLSERQAEMSRRVGEAARAEQPPEDGSGPPTGAMLDSAREQLDRAAEALRRGDLDGAARLQANAMQTLRDARDATGQGQSQAGGERDPLGRLLPGRRDDGRSTRVPDQQDRLRARDVREELRRRQADPSRPADERGYIDRLLED